MSQPKKIKDVFHPLSGIFFNLSELYGDKYPWADEIADVAYLARSGNKVVAPIVAQIMDTDDFNGLIRDKMTLICTLIDRKYGTTWKKLYDVLSLEYNPIENYKTTEVATPDITRQTDTSTETDITTEDSGENADDVYGFNSTIPVPTDYNKNTSTSRVTADADKNAEHRTYTETGSNTIEKHGNIGVTTNQQMIESEIELWKWNFLDTVFSQLDSLITCPLYYY